jgi:hypothetical protein
VDKAIAQAHARQKATFNPRDDTPNEKGDVNPKAKRHVSFGVDGTTGHSSQDGKVKRRESKRSHTVHMRTVHVDRMKKMEQSKVRATYLSTLHRMLL